VRLPDTVADFVNSVLHKPDASLCK